MLLRFQAPKIFFICPLIFICILGIFVIQNSSIDKEKTLERGRLSDLQNFRKVQLGNLEKLPSLGFGNLIADLAYLDFIQYYGNTKERDLTDYDLAPDYFKVIVQKDPRFVHAYFLLEPATTLFAGRPDISNNLMTKGLKYLTSSIPLAYQVWLYKGINEVLFLGQIEEAKKSYLKAAEWGREGGDHKSLLAADGAEETAQFLAHNPDSKVARAGAWLQILSNAKDVKTRQLALVNLKKLGAEVTINVNSISVKVPQENH